MASHALSAGLAAVALGLFARPSWCASWPDSIALQVTVCEDAFLDRVQAERALRSELEADGVRRVAARGINDSADASLRLSIGCTAPMTTSVALRSEQTGREHHRDVVLGDTDRAARARVLALAVAEIVRSEWPELAAKRSSPVPANTSPAAPPETSPKAPAAAASATFPDQAEPATNEQAPSQRQRNGAALIKVPRSNAKPDERPVASVGHTAAASERGPPRRTGLTLSADAQLRWFFTSPAASFGASGGVGLGAFRLRAEGLWLTSHDSRGDASLGIAALCLGLRVIDTKLGPVSIAAYPTVAAGLSWVGGTAARASVSVNEAKAFYGDVRLSLESRLHRIALSPGITAEVGRASGFEARAGQHVVAASGGFFVGAAAGGRY